MKLYCFQTESFFVLKFRPWFCQIILHAKFSKRYVLHEIIIFSQAKSKLSTKAHRAFYQELEKMYFVVNRLGQF